MGSHRQFDQDELDEQFDDWSVQRESPDIDDAEIKKLVREELDLIKSMSQEEYTLWQKWNEIQDLFPGKKINTLWGEEAQPTSEDQLISIRRVLNRIWVPEKPDDYLNLEPELVYVNLGISITSVDIWGRERVEEYENPDFLAEDWRILRIFISTHKHSGTIGRSLNYLVRDRVSKQYLGVVTISGDFLDLTPRDQAVGWDANTRVENQKIQHTAMGSTIVPTQPFGYNYLGGKLCALLCLSNEIASRWENTYGQRFVGVTTTSLYGKGKGGHGMSMYDNLKHWKKCGYSKGAVLLQLSPPVEELKRKWMWKNHAREYWEFFVAKDRNGAPMSRDAVNRSNQFFYRKMGMKIGDVTSNHDRGVYFAKLYSNAFEFLRGEISEDKLKPLFDNSTEYLVDLWKTKYAPKRINRLVEKGTTNFDVSFYQELVALSWDETKEIFLSQVGR
jgi:hypothetical protein